MTPRFVLGELVKQLAYTTHGLAQLDALVGSLLAHLSGAATTFPSTFLAEYQQLTEVERASRLDEAVEKAVTIWQEVDDTYLRRLLQAPFVSGATQRALLAWLSGRDCDVTQLARIGANASLAEELIVPALRTLCSVAALGAPIVLVMDQLENLIEGAEPGARLLGYANLAAELVDVMRGLVLVHMALDTEWTRGIEPALNMSQRSRLLMRTETLSLPTSREREELLRLWIDRLPERTGPYPWPFTDKRLARVLGTPGMTPRMLLVECGQALDAGGADEEPESGPEQAPAPLGLTGQWEGCLDAARQVQSEADEQRTAIDAVRLADGLLACGHFLTDSHISTSSVGEPVQLVIDTGKAKRQAAVLQHSHYKSLGAALGKLTTLAARTEVVAIRERARDLPPTWKDTLAKRNALLETGRARWVWLEPDDVTRLLALDALLQGARSGDVTNERGEPLEVASVIGWVRETLAVPEWGVVRALLGQTAEEPAVEATPSAVPDQQAAAPTAEPPGTGVAVAILRQLRIASVERVVREAARIDPLATRAKVLSELEAGPGIRFFGRSIVCVRVQQ
ncbi:MAG TPA: hypothetical protein VH062_24120 [Polyangiaceae bacterium]|jgi:hypothetical protein|nr:hypothetical protein [Polyangiaceae bacterium]